MGPIRAARKTRRTLLRLEELEDRLVPASLEPTSVEQFMLEQLNDARANPAAYGQSIGVDLSNVAASQPLAWDGRLIAAARGHSQEMNDRGYFGHTDSIGRNAGQRMVSEGYSHSGWGESIAAGYPNNTAALRGLIIDEGIPDLGHRRHLLAIDTVFKSHSQVGIGIVLDGSGPYSDYYTIDTATPRGGGVFLTGVVFSDNDRDGKYDIGEGLSGVTINVAGFGSTTSFASGGYSIRVAAGSHNVTASGGLGGTFSQAVTVGTTNYRLQITPTQAGTTIAPVPTEPTITPAQHAANQATVDQLFVTLLKRQPTSGERDNNTAALDEGQATRDSLSSQIKSGQEYGTVCTVWLRQAYSDLLGRNIGAAEIEGWMPYLRGNGSVEGAANAIVNSQERRNFVWSGWVRDVYQTNLRRTPGAGEISQWKGHFQNGWTKETLAGVVIGSGEYQNRIGSTNVAFVTALYQDVLGRTPGSTEVSGWVGALNNGHSRGAVIAGFLGSIEYRWRQNSLWSARLFSDFLGRTGTTSEVQAMASTLNAGANANAILISTLGSVEYYNRAASS